MMRAPLQTLRILTEIAFRNLLASKWKTLIVGGIIAFGAWLVVIGSSLLDAVDHSMRRSITSSLAGHIQVYSSESKDEIQILGGMSGEAPNLAPLEDFAGLRKLLLAIPNVAAVVPMGLNIALASTSNGLDQALADVRASARTLQSGAADPELQQRYAAQKAHVRQILRVLCDEVQNAKRINRRAGLDELSAIEEANSDRFWKGFERDPFAQLEFLENKVAGTAADSDAVFVRYIGTDPDLFARVFDRMEIVDGEAIPTGKRGFLFSKYMYEEQVKLRAARGLDKLKAAIEQRHAKISEDAELQRIVRENTQGVRELVLQLDAIKTESFRQKLQAFLHAAEQDVAKLLSELFATDDANFHERYRFFYAELAPELRLYRVNIGDTLTIEGFTRTGYVRSANLKVYGTFRFKGLEQSPQAGLTNMMDLVSFRELNGFVTDAHQHELAAMQAAAGSKDVSRESAEAELFGSKPSSEASAAAPSDGRAALAEALARMRGTRGVHEQAELASYDPKQLEQGAILNAAVMLKDEDELEDTLRQIERAGKRAGLPLKAAPWQQAAGIFGQFAALMRGVLYTAVLIIFLVALVVINNALVMATLERGREIGTLRAIGAPRRFILAMLVLESIAIGAVSGAFGAGLGGVLLLALGRTGIPAVNDILAFAFAGARLFPVVGWQELSFALATVLVVSIASGMYPAWLAMHVSPREAMQGEE